MQLNKKKHTSFLLNLVEKICFKKFMEIVSICFSEFSWTKFFDKWRNYD